MVCNDEDLIALIARLRKGDTYDGQTICCKLDRCNCSLMADAADELERMQRLLDGRDKFIVDRGLLSDFVAQLPV